MATRPWLLVLLVGLLAVFLQAPSHASAAEIKTSPNQDVPVAPSQSICGRPLGIAFHQKSGDLYIADAHKGLLRVGLGGGEAEVLATGVDGVPFHFVNGVDVDQATGDVYFTDSSTTYPRRFDTEIMTKADATGRLLKYEARTKLVTVLKDGLPYPNGVAVSHDGTYVVVTHTVLCQAHRYYLHGAKTGQYELMADLPGYPDNVRRDGKGGYWVAKSKARCGHRGSR